MDINLNDESLVKTYIYGKVKHKEYKANKGLVTFGEHAKYNVVKRNSWGEPYMITISSRNIDTSTLILPKDAEIKIYNSHKLETISDTGIITSRFHMEQKPPYMNEHYVYTYALINQTELYLPIMNKGDELFLTQIGEIATIEKTARTDDNGIVYFVNYILKEVYCENNKNKQEDLLNEYKKSFNFEIEGVEKYIKVLTELEELRERNKYLKKELKKERDKSWFDKLVHK